MNPWSSSGRTVVGDPVWLSLGNASDLGGENVRGGCPYQAIHGLAVPIVRDSSRYIRALPLGYLAG